MYVYVGYLYLSSSFAFNPILGITVQIDSILFYSIMCILKCQSLESHHMKLTLLVRNNILSNPDTVQVQKNFCQNVRVNLNRIKLLSAL